jgi:hypothetical protein
VIVEADWEPGEHRQCSDCPPSGGLRFDVSRLTCFKTDMIKQIKTLGGDWPTTNENLVNNYLQIFINFVKSIDVTDLQ